MMGKEEGRRWKGMVEEGEWQILSERHKLALQLLSWASSTPAHKFVYTQ